VLCGPTSTGSHATADRIFAADFCLGFESSSSSSLGQSSLVLRLGFLPLLKEGDEVRVKLMEIDDRGRLNLSMKAVK
jgi:polyribonucleotide nucleotidyltransferase